MDFITIIIYPLYLQHLLSVLGRTLKKDDKETKMDLHRNSQL